MNGLQDFQFKILHFALNLNDGIIIFLGLETANLTIDKLKKQIQENVTGIQNRHQTGPDLVSITGMYVSFVLPLRENVLNFLSAIMFKNVSNQKPPK